MKSLNLLIAFIICIALTNCSTTKKTGSNKLKEINIKTSSVCGMCKETIEKAMAYEKGVKQFDLNVKSKLIMISYNPSKTTPEKIRLAISKVGYDADGIEADLEAYNKLPACCKKDVPPH